MPSTIQILIIGELVLICISAFILGTARNIDRKRFWKDFFNMLLNILLITTAVGVVL